MNLSSPAAEPNGQQIESLCDELDMRVETARREEAMLEQLVAVTAGPRPFRSKQYRSLLETTRCQIRRFYDLVERYCRRR